MNQKLSLNMEFSPFEVPKPNTEGFTVNKVIPLRNSAFGLPDTFWDWIRGDETLKAAFDQMIEVKVQERVRADFAQIQAQVTEEAKKQGLQQGIDLAQGELSSIKEELFKLVQAIAAEKENLLKQDSKTWVQTFEKIVKDFFRETPQMSLQRIAQFFDEKIQEFHVQGKVQVECASQVFEHLSKISSEKITLKVNETMTGNAFKIHWEEGQILFDESKAMESLSSILRETLTNDTNSK